MRFLTLALGLLTFSACDSANPYDPIDCGEPGELQVEDLVEGNGATARATSTVEATFRGHFPDGTEFQPTVTDDVNLQGNYILGFKQGIVGMRAPGGVDGQPGKRRITVPPNLGYGGFPQRNRAGEVTIPACSTLIFEVEVLDIVG